MTSSVSSGTMISVVVDAGSVVVVVARGGWVVVVEVLSVVSAEPQAAATMASVAKAASAVFRCPMRTDTDRLAIKGKKTVGKSDVRHH